MCLGRFAPGVISLVLPLESCGNHSDISSGVSVLQRRRGYIYKSIEGISRTSGIAKDSMVSHSETLRSYTLLPWVPFGTYERGH